MDAEKKEKFSVKKTAEIAHLNLSSEEEIKFSKDIDSILSAFKIMNKVNVERTKISLHPVRTENHLRKDEINESISQESALIETKQKRNGFFIAPKTA